MDAIGLNRRFSLSSCCVGVLCRFLLGCACCFNDFEQAAHGPIFPTGGGGMEELSLTKDKAFLAGKIASWVVEEALFREKFAGVASLFFASEPGERIKGFNCL